MKEKIKTAIRSWLRRQGFLIAKHPRTDYTQLSIFDLAIILMMRAQGNQVRFVQIGANDGVYGDSISRYAFKYPWQGILVEPQPDIFKKLVENYRSAPGRYCFENIAIAAANLREITLWRPKPSANGRFDSTIASARFNNASSQATNAGQGMEPIQVPCLTLTELLTKHQWNEVDLLLIDTEGLDYEVLQTLDFSQVRPTVIQFEHGHLTPAEIDGAISLLHKNGYHIAYGGTCYDTIAIQQSAWDHWRPVH